MTENDDQKKSFSYWENAKTTYLASPEYYDKQEIEMRKIFATYGPFLRGLDLGCGDGRYTYVASEYAKEMVGLDIGPHLLAQAMHRKRELGDCLNIEFLMQSVTDLEYSNEFDLVMCLGVTSALIELQVFRKVIMNIARSMSRGGTLIMKDTMAKGDTYTSIQQDYIACYRNQALYFKTIEDAGYEFLECQELITANDLTVNAICVFRKTE